jgi:adenylate kinase
VIPGARVVILGRQGAGKGTQCTRLSRHYVVPHVSTGEILRSAVKDGTALGRQAKAFMDAGDLVPDDVMIGIVDERLQRPDAMRRGYVLDGFPRTAAQAQALDAMITERPLDAVIDLEVSRDIVLARLAARRVCLDCGANYSVAVPPKQNWTCDFCGGEVVQRDDDTEEAIARRLDLYDLQTAPLVDYYKRQTLLEIVDGVGSADEVLARLVQTIDAARERRSSGT